MYFRQPALTISRKTTIPGENHYINPMYHTCFFPAYRPNLTTSLLEAAPAVQTTKRTKGVWYYYTGIVVTYLPHIYVNPHS
jgi:hypothetical protein